MHCARELEVERGVVFGQNVLAIGLFAHLDVGDRVAALRQVRYLRGGVIGRAVEQGDGNHGGEIVGDAADEEEIESGLIAVIVEVGVGVPGISRGAERRSLVLVGAVLDQVDEIAGGGESSNVEFAEWRSRRNCADLWDRAWRWGCWRTRSSRCAGGARELE
jgi:hypothetical protein